MTWMTRDEYGWLGLTIFDKGWLEMTSDYKEYMGWLVMTSDNWDDWKLLGMIGMTGDGGGD